MQMTRIRAGRILLPPTASVAMLLVFGCQTIPGAPVPMRTLEVPGSSSSCTVVLIPGRGSVAEDLVRHGFIERARAAGIDSSFVLADANLGYFVNQTLTTRLHDDVVGPLRGRGQSCIWLAGISLGGTAALLYAAEHPGEIRGVVLLSPYLGDRQVRHEIQRAGGPLRWSAASSRSSAFDRAIWQAVSHLTQSSSTLPIYLGYGTFDRFSRSHRLLAGLLPRDRVSTVFGGHSWRVWKHLWDGFCERHLMVAGEVGKSPQPGAPVQPGVSDSTRGSQRR
jgi:pimeloyl-ACP methyl ester carboxylesterase